MIFNKNISIWIGSYIKSILFRKNRKSWNGPVHVYFMIADHFEPYWNNANENLAHRRVDLWITKLPSIEKIFSDSDGKHPKHVFFYPEEQYDERIIDKISCLCTDGWGDFEVHMHHDQDTSENVRGKLTAFKEKLHYRHGLLRKVPGTGNIIYGFIHGNWALDNSDSKGKWCGVNDEISILGETGCYADFTLPSAPSDTQTKKINSIYYAIDDVEKPKSHNDGKDIQFGRIGKGDLLIIQGPLALNWKNRKYGIFPRIENGEISHGAKATYNRICLWMNYAPRIMGKEMHVFIKIHTHGCDDKNLSYLLDHGGLESLYRCMVDITKERKNCRIHFVTGYDMYNKINDLEKEKER